MEDVRFYGQNTIDVIEELVDQCDAFLGCVAWCTHPNLLRKMERKNLGMVINNTDYENDWFQNFLEEKYARMSFKSDTPIILRGFDDRDLLDGWSKPLPELGQVLKVGEPHSFSTSSRTQMMHCKFLVFGKIERVSKYFATTSGEWNENYTSMDTDISAFVPYACWVGSCNLTAASTENDECGVIIRNQKVALQAIETWFELYMQRSTFSQ